MTTYPNLSHSLPTLPKGMGRRNFLFLGSAFSASLLLPIALKSSRLLPISQSEDSPTAGLTDSLLSIGFLPHPEAATSRDALQLLSASHLQTGDSTFLQRGAQVTIQGINNPMNLQSMSAYIHYQPTELQEEVKVCAWCATYKPILNLTATNRLLVPVQASQGLKLSFDWKAQTSETPLESMLAQFSVGDEPNLPKLQRGTYLIAGRSHQTNQLPVWQNYQMKAVELDSLNDRLTVSSFDLAHKTWIPADFPYLQISIDHGTVTA